MKRREGWEIYEGVARDEIWKRGRGLAFHPYLLLGPIYTCLPARVFLGRSCFLLYCLLPVFRPSPGDNYTLILFFLDIKDFRYIHQYCALFAYLNYFFIIHKIWQISYYDCVFLVYVNFFPLFSIESLCTDMLNNDMLI